MKLVPYIHAASAILFEDDGSLAPELKKVSLVWDNNKETGRLEREEKHKGHKIYLCPLCVLCVLCG